MDYTKQLLKWFGIYSVAIIIYLITTDFTLYQLDNSIIIVCGIAIVVTFFHRLGGGSLGGYGYEVITHKSDTTIDQKLLKVDKVEGKFKRIPAYGVAAIIIVLIDVIVLRWFV